MASALRGYPDDADRDREPEGLLEASTRTGCKNCCEITFPRQHPPTVRRFHKRYPDRSKIT